ncbi:conjugal transfer protein TraN [Klebsiella pneumoniae subsp. pneumoniae]|nr:conjugal transfer protein TraN [Klebsiella pneumoniae subsp. pneumoniae]
MPGEKESYCQFDSKLAQIVQQQGKKRSAAYRFWRSQQSRLSGGLRLKELQRIDFNMLDFTNFMDDLMKNQKIPENDVLTNKTKERIKEIMSQQSAQ